MQQIGGKRFAVMTGSRNFMDLGDGVRMNLARNKTSANRLAITLDKGTDTSDAVLPNDGKQAFRGEDERHCGLRGRLL